MSRPPTPTPPATRRRTLVWAVASALLATMTTAAPATLRNQEVVAPHGIVASAHPLASQAGIEMLQAGGNAVDAAVAAAFAIGVVEPQASGIGGEGVMLIYLAGPRTTVAIDYKSVAPAILPATGRSPASGHAAVAVPGTVAGLATALQRHGTMRLAQVLAPAIRFAEEGFEVSPTLAAAVTEGFEVILANPPLAATLCPEGLPIEAGAVLRNTELGATLRRIAAGGPEVFYHGEIAATIAAEMAEHGGSLSAQDLASYQPLERAPVHGKYRGYTILSAPPPVGGTPVVEALQILDRFKLAKGSPLAPTTIHITAEALKRGFADSRAFVADPAFIHTPLDRLLSRSYARQRAGEINPTRITPQVLPGLPAVEESPSTTSLAVVDRHGSMVALTQTLSDFFGARVMVAGTGIILNNEMRNFSTSGINAAAPGKRMRTTIAPTVVLRRGRPFAVLGTPGGARITSTMVLLISNLVDHKMGIQEAIEAPRYFARETEKDLFVEDRMPPGTLDALERLGYTYQVMKDYDLFFGGAQGIVIDHRSGQRHGGADPRRDGAVLGY